MIKRERRPSPEFLLWTTEIALIFLAWALLDTPLQSIRMVLMASMILQIWMIYHVFKGYGLIWGMTAILVPPIPIAFFWLDRKRPRTKRLASGFLIVCLLMTAVATALGKGTLRQLVAHFLTLPEESVTASSVDRQSNANILPLVSTISDTTGQEEKNPLLSETIEPEQLAMAGMPGNRLTANKIPSASPTLNASGIQNRASLASNGLSTASREKSNIIKRSTSPEVQPVILYTWSDCSDFQCQKIRTFLEEKKVVFIQKSLKDDVSVQQEMQREAKTKKLIHPVVIVPGAKPIKGYNRIKLEEVFK